jgi:hypothetical protein
MRRLLRRLPLRRTSVCASILWLFSTACAAPPHGEWDPRQCSDGVDNDADGRIDCADPDCWAYACAGRMRDAGVAQGGSAGSDMSGSGAALGGMHAAGSGGRTSLPDLEDAGGTPLQPDDDAGVTPMPECSATRADDCGTGRECISGRCQPVDISGRYVLSIVSALVPARNSLGACFDPDVWCALGACDGSCQPDPYVVVTKNSVARVGATSTQTDTTAPKWTGVKLEVQLGAGDSLLFGVWDADTFGNAELFSCSPQLQAQIRSGNLRCSPSTRTDGSYEVIAKITRL